MDVMAVGACNVLYVTECELYVSQDSLRLSEVCWNVSAPLRIAAGKFDTLTLFNADRSDCMSRFLSAS
jgi:hypothetical protein